MGARGMTLIELMITMAVVAILAAVAYPSYMSFIIRGNRSQAQQFLMQLAQRQESYRLDQGQYAATLAALGLPPPTTVSSYYNAPDPYVTAAGLPFFAAELTPVAGSPQAADGRLFINSRGETWRDPVSGCALSACSSADGTAIAWN